MRQENLYVVTYDIGNPKRWREVYRILNGYGEWIQLSVFQCRLSKRRHAELIAALDPVIHHNEDHVLLLDLGPASSVSMNVVSLGKNGFDPMERNTIIV